MFSNFFKKGKFIRNVFSHWQCDSSKFIWKTFENRKRDAKMGKNNLTMHSFFVSFISMKNE